MDKVTTGISDLDRLLDSIHMGDNVVWEVEAGTSVGVFIKGFVTSSLDSECDVIYVSFNKSPQSVLKHLGRLQNPEGLTIIDCFTAGKGKNDPAFRRFYDDAHTYPRVIKIEKPHEIGHFTEAVNGLQDEVRPGARYVFDSLTGIQDLWGNEEQTFKYFTFMCPRLFDLSTVAYWILEKDAHSGSFKANLRHITQVVLNLSKRREKLFVKAMKLEGRLSREAFKAHEYCIDDSGVVITEERKDQAFQFGGRVREARSRLGMSQKELADNIGLTASYVSQLENNQISPSLNSFLQLCSSLGLTPSALLDNGSSTPSWHIEKKSVLLSPVQREDGYAVYRVSDLGENRGGVYLIRMEPETTVDKHLIYHRGEELVYVLRGVASVTYKGLVEFVSEGDVARFRDDFPTRWNNASDRVLELLVVTA